MGRYHHGFGAFLLPVLSRSIILIGDARRILGHFGSDFFTGYDSMPCPQQKCLVHLVRDLDDDLLHNPFNKQFKRFAQDFGSLLRPIIETVDRYGLKKRHLGKHKRDVERCLKAIHALRPDSDLVDKYRNRFIKYWPKMLSLIHI